MAGSAGVSTSPNDAIRVTHRVVASNVDSLYPILGVKRLLPPPALGERCHRSLARRLVAVDRRAIFVLAIGQRPHPWCAYPRKWEVVFACPRKCMFVQKPAIDGGCL